MVRRRRSVHPTNDTKVSMADQQQYEAAVASVRPQHISKLEKEEDMEKRIHLIKSIACSLQSKKVIRAQHALDTATGVGCWQSCVQRRKMSWRRTKISWREFTIRLELWRGSFKTIEGHYGSGVAAYFVFLKWLFVLNLWIFLVMFVFIVVPQIVFTAQGYNWWSVGNISTDRLNLSAICSELYRVEIQSDDVPQLILDFLQGTGWLEPTVLFYGYYSDKHLAIGTFNDDTFYYNMPLAYLLVTAAYIIISLVMMVRHTAGGLTARIVESAEDRNLQYNTLVFAGWDHTVTTPSAVSLKQKSIFNEIGADLEEERRVERSKARTGGQKCGLYTLRFLINVFVLVVLGGAGYLIFYATQQSAEITQRSDYDDMNKFVQLLVEFIPSLTITFLNFIIPFVFQKIVKGEDYSPDTEVHVTLGRTVFLRLASLAVLLATIYSVITCSDKDSCGVGTGGDCPEIRCWETYVGQQIYKLVILDFFIVLFVVLFINFPRTLIVTKCDCKISRLVGKPEFEIPKHVLDLVYSQTLCWLGAFFSPLIPAICVVKSFVFFYLKKVTCIYNHVPAAKPYRASKSQSFFMIVLLTAFLMTCVPIGYIVFSFSPSTGCGPFRIFSRMYDILDITIDTWPSALQTIFSLITSAGIIIPLVALLCVLVYYYAAIASANKKMANIVRRQLHMVGKDKKFLLTRLTELTGSGPPGAGRHIHDQMPSRTHKPTPSPYKPDTSTAGHVATPPPPFTTSANGYQPPAEGAPGGGSDW